MTRCVWGEDRIPRRQCLRESLAGDLYCKYHTSSRFFHSPVHRNPTFTGDSEWQDTDYLEDVGMSHVNFNER